MIIQEVVLREIRLRLREPFRISSGVWQDRRVLLVTLRADGHEGWAECVAAEDPSYSEETTETAWHVLSEWVLPRVPGLAIDQPTDVLGSVSWIRGNRMATASVEMAAWDLLAKHEGHSLADRLGGSREAVEVGVSVGIQETDAQLVDKVGEYLERGYRRIKVKVGPGRDLEPLRGLRERFGGIPLMADANSAYTLDDLAILRELDRLDLMMIEQPLAPDDFLDHARLQAELSTPICLDESIRSLRDAELALHLDSGRIINIKPGRVGGLTEARRIHDLCERRGVPVWCGGMLESGIGRAHNLALATLSNFTLPGDISESQRYWDEDIVEPEFTVDSGLLSVPDGAGIGVAPRSERIEALTVRSISFP